MCLPSRLDGAGPKVIIKLPDYCFSARIHKSPDVPKGDFFWQITTFA